MTVKSDALLNLSTAQRPAINAASCSGVPTMERLQIKVGIEKRGGSARHAASEKTTTSSPKPMPIHSIKIFAILHK